MTTRIKLRRDTAANWAENNPILALGEPGLETDSNKIKYGDGTTAWNNLDYAGGSNNFSHTFSNPAKTWHSITVQGAKEFTYYTPGHRYFEITLTQALSSASTIVIPNATADLTPVATCLSRGSGAYVWINDINSNGGRYPITGTVTLTGGNWTISEISYNGSPTTISANIGDKLVIQYWYKGSEVNWYNHYYIWDIVPYAATTSSNSIQFDSTRFGMTNFTGLESNSGHSIIFDRWKAGGSDTRNITNVSVVGDIYTITFDGSPKSTSYITLQTPITTTPTNNGTDSQEFRISRTAHPQLKNLFRSWWGTTFSDVTGGTTSMPYSTGARSGYITFPGAVDVNFAYLDYADDNDWVLFLDSATTWTSTDEITINWYNHPTMIDFDVYDPTGNLVNQGGASYGYRWFDWHEDLGVTYNNGSGNGVVGGKAMIWAQVIPAKTNYDTSSQMYQLQWAQQGQNWIDPMDLGHYVDSNAGNTGPYLAWDIVFNNHGACDRFDIFGISFMSTWGPDGTWEASEELKVRIIYKMDLIINSEPQEYD